MMLEAIVGVIGTVVVSASVGLINLYAKVSVHEERYAGLAQLIDTKFAALSEHFDDSLNPLEKRLDRIERSMNGHLRKD
jgi:hypothetical protein